MGCFTKPGKICVLFIVYPYEILIVFMIESNNVKILNKFMILVNFVIKFLNVL